MVDAPVVVGDAEVVVSMDITTLVLQDLFFVSSLSCLGFRISLIGWEVGKERLQCELGRVACVRG